jgi:predicted ATPase
VASALAMREALQAYALELRDSVSFEYRIGLNTGPVVVGTIGNDLTMDYTAVGDTVNLAARMEGWASPGAIYITGSTQKLVAPYFELRDLGSLEVKGKSEAVPAFEVIRELAERTRLDASVERGLTPYVGRDEQLAQLRTLFEQARSGHGQVAFITGEAGIGKSRLLLEFRRALAGTAAWLEGRCISWGETFPYLPVMGIVKGVFGIDEGHDAATIHERVASVAGRWDEAVAPALPFLKFLLNVEAGDEVLNMDAAMRHQRILDALRKMALQESRHNPIVIVLEDLHWIDDQSSEALAALVDIVAPSRILLILTLRPGYAHGLGDRTYFNRLALRNLAPEDSVSMVYGVLQAAGMPAELRQMIVAKAEGNPFFIEEVSRALLDSGAIRRTEDGYVLTRPAAQVSIPNTVQEVLLSRIDRLPAATKAVVQRAAIIGREFPVRLLERVSGEEPGGLLETLGHLKAMELLYETAFIPEAQFTFKHALTQEVALSTLLGERTRALHRDVAMAIEDLYADRLGDYLEALAYHYAEAEVWDKALQYSSAVAERAQRLHAPRAVIEHLTRAITAGNHLGLPADPVLLRDRGVAHEHVGDFERAQADHEAALAAARELSDRRAEWQAHADLGMLWAGRDYDRTGQYFEQAHTLAREIGELRLIASSLNRIANYHLNLDDPVAALQYHEEAMSIFTELEDKRGIAETADFLQMAHGLRGDMERSYEYWRQGVELWRELGERQNLANLLASFMFCGPSAETETLVPVDPHDVDLLHSADEALEIAREIGWRAGEAYALIQCTMHANAEGLYERSLQGAGEALAISTQIGHSQWRAGSHTTLAVVYTDILDLERARWNAEEALRIALEIGSRHWMHLSAANCAMIAAADGRLDDAEAILAEYLTDDTSMLSVSQRSLWLARVISLLLRGDYEESIGIMDRLVATAKNIDGRDASAIPYLGWLRGRALIGLGRYDEAAVYLAAAQAGAVTYGCRPLEWRVLQSLAELHAARGSATDALNCYRDALRIIDQLSQELKDPQLRTTFLRSAPVTAIRDGAAAASF